MTATKMKSPVLLRPDCVQLGGDIVVGTLLSQIAYWSSLDARGKSKLRVIRNGVYWIAKTREQWMAETGLTLEQYKRAIGVLKAKQLVEVKVMRFGGLAMGHVRLLQPIATTPTVRPVSTPPPGWCVTHQPSTESTDTENEQTSTGATGATGSKGWLMKASEVLKTHKTGVSSSLGAYWKSRMALEWGGYQHPLTGKEAGQLKQLSKYLGDQTKPVIDYVMQHWAKFANLAGIAAGSSVPSEPHIGFLLKHHAVAVNLLTPGVALPTQVEHSPPSLHSVATGTEDQPVHTLSSQELTELLDGLKSP